MNDFTGLFLSTALLIISILALVGIVFLSNLDSKIYIEKKDWKCTQTAIVNNESVCTKYEIKG